MIFASDLDRTLIYSKRAIKEFGVPEGLTLTPVEQKAGNWVAYMTETSYNLLKELSSQNLFVPVTTRTTEQFHRFVIFAQDIRIKYAITSNGATILEQGEPMKEWSNQISNRLKLESVSQAELLSILARANVCLDGELKQAEGWFFYFLLNCLLSDSERRSIEDLVAEFGWRISQQGRKLYFIPQPINKGNALEFICNLEGAKPVAGAGDSLLDWDFLKNCQYRFVPNHGELSKQLANVSDRSSSILTINSGVGAGEEILQQFHQLMQTNPILLA
jgi:hydroxymethylpyrimidine pyrophosphatase-like HAD family hydrolase